MQSLFSMKKRFVLGVLFVLPLVAYLFFASGITNFGKLPILKTQIPDVSTWGSQTTMDGKITVLGFLGNSINTKKGNAFNLNQKIYKRFNEFTDFQILMVIPKGSEAAASELKEELGALSNVDRWNFAYGSDTEIRNLFNQLETNLVLDENLATPYVFIVDKERNLRGRDDDEDDGVKYGFNTASVADLNNKMEDDVKIILAEYRLAKKKNNANRIK